jgi:putative intracellular protease/amidase
MEDLAFDADSGKLLVEALASGKPLAVVCHGPAALLATRDTEGTSPFASYRITGYTDDEEAALGLASRAKWLMEDEVTDKVGVEFSRGPIWQPFTVVDRNLYTGQILASAGPLAKELLRVLS